MFFAFSLVLGLFSLTLVSSKACSPIVTLLNQDPYPAVPGSYVKLVFQVKGLDSVSCGNIKFNLSENYPIRFNPGENGLREFNKVDYINGYESNLLVPFEVRIDGGAIGGENPIKVNIENKKEATISKTLEVEVKDVRTNFEIYVKDYDYKTHQLTFEILNIGKSDIKALTVEVPKQNSIQIKGANQMVVGDLDSDEYTSASFEAVPKNGNFNVDLIYSDIINKRRTITKTVSFDSSYFTNRISDEGGISKGTYIFWIVVIILVIYWWVKNSKRKKKLAKSKGF